MRDKMDDYSQLLTLAGENYKTSAGYSAAGAFADMIGAQLNYSALKTEYGQLKVQASNIELQAKQQANILRDQFLNSVGSYQFGAAQRGISVGSGSVQQNIMSSSENLGRDIQRIQQNANMQASALRTQAQIMKNRATLNRNLSLVKGATSLLGSYSTYQKGSDILSKVGGGNG